MIVERYTGRTLHNSRTLHTGRSLQYYSDIHVTLHYVNKMNHFIAHNENNEDDLFRNARIVNHTTIV